MAVGAGMRTDRAKARRGTPSERDAGQSQGDQGDTELHRGLAYWFKGVPERQWHRNHNESEIAASRLVPE